MAIHVSIGYRDGFLDRGQPYVKVLEKTFEQSEIAVMWWEDTGFNDGDGSVLDVLRAARGEYVGTEHEIMTPNAHKDGHSDGGYTKLWCCIEGQEGKDTFDDRFKDLFVEEIVYMGDGQYQLNGKDIDGRRVWQSVHLKKDCKFKVSEVIHLPE